MTASEKISVATAALNALTFVVMATALLFQGKALRRSRRDTEVALLGVRSQSIATLITYLHAKLAGLDPKAGLDVQRDRNNIGATLSEQVSQLNAVLERISALDKED